MRCVLRIFCKFIFCLSLILGLLGCAAPITLESLHALNPRALVSKTCVNYEGVPRDAHFGAVQFATGKVVTDRDPEALLQFVQVADAIHEFSCTDPIVSTRAEVERAAL